MTGPCTPALARVVVTALLLAALSGCNHYVAYGAAAGGVVGGASLVTGRNPFYLADKYFGPSCESFSYFDRPTRCVNDPG